MKKISNIFLIFLLSLTLCQCASVDTNKELAEKKATEAVQLMNDGKYDESIKLLEEAQKLDPDKIEYPYETSYAYTLKKEYQTAITILEDIIGHKDAPDLYYQLLGNNYDNSGNSDKALEVYERGLKKFPSSGRLYLEKGNVFWNKKEYEKAVPLYEKGIEVDPQFPSNYYRAAKLYCNSVNSVWGLIYGEIFVNLERNSARTEEMSKLLFDTYKKNIKITSDSVKTSFCSNTISTDDIPKDTSRKLIYGPAVYEMTLALSLIGTTSIDINSLELIRKKFIDLYYQKEFDRKYPNILFEYHKKLIESGYFEAYNHWLLIKGDKKGFDYWFSYKGEKWNNFLAWFKDNPLKIDLEHRFYRRQY